MDTYSKRQALAKIQSKSYSESVCYFKKLKEIIHLIVKAICFDVEHESYLSLIASKDKTASAIKNQEVGFRTTLKIFELKLYEFIEDLDKNIFELAKSECGDGRKTGKYNDNGSINHGYFWIYLKSRLIEIIDEKDKKKLEEDVFELIKKYNNQSSKKIQTSIMKEFIYM